MANNVEVVHGRSISADFANFQSQHPLRKAHIPRANVDWLYYQSGPANDQDPIVFIHGTSGTAAAFFYQLHSLSKKGFRVVSAQFPCYSAPGDWCKGFDLFLDVLKCRSAHLFGAGLGGFLAQHFAVQYPQRVRSLILCNAFMSTEPFAEQAGALAAVIPLTPTPILRKLMLDNFPTGGMELSVKQAIDWVAQQVNDLSGDDLAGRLSLNCNASNVSLVPLSARDRITLIESNDKTMVPDELRYALRRRYPDAQVAELKLGGDFPFVSRPDEVSLYVEVHMRKVGVFGVSNPSPPQSLPEPEEQTCGERRHIDIFEEPAQRQAAQPRAWRNPFEDDDL